MWAVWFISMNKQLHIYPLPSEAFRSFAMMDSQLHCLDGFRFLMKPEAQQTESRSDQPVGPEIVPGHAWSGHSMCRGSNVKDKRVIAFQLESLILAQNERWRQA